MQPGHLDLRIDGSRLLRRIAALAEISPIDGGGSNRLALTDADKEGRDLVVAWMHDLGLDVGIDEIGNVVGTRAGREPGPPVMTGLAHRHRAHWRPLRREPGRAGRPRSDRSARSRRRDDAPTACRRVLHERGGLTLPTRHDGLADLRRRSSRSEEALDISSIDGPTVGDELARIGYAGALPCPGPAPAAFVELHIEQGPVLEAQTRDDRSRRRGAGDLVAGAHDRRPVEPRGYDADVDAPRRGVRGGRDRLLRAAARGRDRGAPGRDGRASRSPS